MVELVTVLRLVGGVVLLLANGFFVTTEFALTRVRQFTEDQFQGPGLERAWVMTERLEIYLSGCQLGITISSVGLGVVAEPAVAAVLAPVVRAAGVTPPGGAAGHTAASVIVALGLINLLHLVVGEQAPTYLGVERTRQVAKYGGPMLYWWTKLTWPVIVVADRAAKWLLGLVGVDITRSWTEAEVDEEPPASRGELRRQMGESLAQFGLTDERREEVLNALEIGDTPVAEVMVDRDDIVALDVDDDLETILDRVREAPHARYPLVERDLETFSGVVYAPELLRHLHELETGEMGLAELAAPPLTVAADTPVSAVIDRFQDESQELALVERDGAVAGLVTATDCFEAITGELEDPLDNERDAARGRSGQSA